MNDYRNTKYCPNLDELETKKTLVKELIESRYPRIFDMYKLISKNGSEYKKEFMRAYNNKCCYCGVSVDICTIDKIEIDHFIHKKSEIFKNTTEAGYIENLVLSCYTCNRKKGSFIINEDNKNYLNPDRNIKNIFYRDESYYIKVKEEYLTNDHILAFYQKLALNSELLRIDFLLMNMIGLSEKLEQKKIENDVLSFTIQKLQKKRNYLKRK